jgi:hypothetical protein
MILALSASAANGARPTAPEVYYPIAPTMTPEEYLLARIGAGRTLEDYLVQIMRTLREYDAADDGLDEADLRRAALIEKAAYRGQAIGTVLRYDLNGDMIVTRKEIETAMVDRQDGRRPESDQLLDRYDADQNGSISLKEVASRPPERADGSAMLQAGRLLLALDPNKDGLLTAQELRAIGEQAFARIDRDGNGTISKEEADVAQPLFAQVQQKMQDQELRMTAPVCAMPALAAGADLVLLSTYEGVSLSSVSVGGQDQETNIIDVAIQPGDEPLYLVLASYESMVWRLTGAVKRVQRVAISSANAAPGGVSASGGVGLPKDKVAILPANCISYFSKTDGRDSLRAEATLERSIGKRPAKIVATYSASAVTLPSGEITTPSRDPREQGGTPAGFDPETWREALRFWPGGVQQVAPASIVARARVEAYSVLPSQAGLAQLVGSGALTKFRSSGKYRIVRPIARFPASMGGAHRADFLLAPGVPVPPGDMLHACLKIEQTGEIKGGPMCNERKFGD